MGMAIAKYFSAVRTLLDDVEAAEQAAMEQTARLFADTVLAGHTLYITGCSHSSIFAQEVFYRAGGFMLMNPLFLPGMTLELPPVTRTTRYERIPGIADAVLEESSLTRGDTLIIASISGRNIVPVELALGAKARGAHVVALTSVPYAESVTSRHPEGHKLHELADVTLDVHCPPGDALVALDGLPEKTGAGSTVIGVVMLHAVISRTLERLLEAGVEPPVFVSANLDGADALNHSRLTQYASRIHYMR